MSAFRLLSRLPVLRSLSVVLSVLALLSAVQAHGADDEPKPQKVSAPFEREMGLPDISYEKALSLNKIEKLETLQEVYKIKIDNNVKMSERLKRRVMLYESNTDLKILDLQRERLVRYIRTLSFGVPDFEELSDADLEELSDVDLVDFLFYVYEAKSSQCTVNADRYSVSLSNINRAIVDLTLGDEGAK